MLRRHAPDVVCLQEAHEYTGCRESQPHQLAREAGYPHVVSFPVSASHLVSDARLALAVLSRFPLGDAVYRRFPNPGLTGTGPQGETWHLADKGYLIVTIQLGDREVALINGHCFPLRYFGAHATDPMFAAGWEMLSQDMRALNDSGPAVVAVDLNHSPVEDVLDEVLGPGGYVDAFAGTVPRVAGAKHDFVLHGRGMRLVSAEMTATQSDHAYRQVCLAVGPPAAGRRGAP